ncbi:hypothetical protein DSO57_1005788 [Entomophthora muscae]|uniref:Uncharacterized protein n=1 Tax=Entomophthora muscae TaxID=34485 RepID=A0ACC2SX08_9FUNG|nr:hypothetical protein DSO57_1005788 [Entomophthora muscae]
MIVLSILVIISILGAAVNVFLFCMLKKIPEKSTSFHLIRIIGATDLFLSLFTLSICFSRPILGPVETYTSWFYCPILSSATFFLCGLSGILMGLLALERYSVICYQRGIPQVVIWMALGIEALAAAVLLAGNSIIGGFAPEPSHLFCMPKGTTWSKYAGIGVDVLFNLPLFVLFFSYIAIFIKCYRANVPNQLESITRKAAIKALLFLFTYIMCYFPKFSTTLIGIFYGLDSPPKFLYLLIPIGMTMLAVVNPILVLLMHRRMKNSVTSYLFVKKSGYSIQLK